MISKKSLITLLVGLAWLPFSTSALAAARVVVKVALYPVGSFEAKTNKMIGKGVRKGSKYSAKELKVPVASLATGISLRDKHLKEKLKFKQFPHIIARDIAAQNGTGKAKITVMDITKDVEFKFKDVDGSSAEAEFKLNLPDFKIEDINYKGVGVEDTLEVKVIVPYDKQ